MLTKLLETNSIEISLYPNPAHDEITIESNRKISQMRVLNLIGEEVKNIFLNEDNFSQPIQLSIGNLPVGNYFVEVTSDQQREVRKIVVE